MHAVLNLTPEQDVKLGQIISKVQDLPSMPAAATRVLQITGNADTNAQMIADAIVLDQALAAKVLKIANSAFYGLSRSVTMVKEAVVVLGISHVRNLVITASAAPWMRRALPGYDLEPKQLLLHGSAVAIGARMIAKSRRLTVADDAFVAGLLADIGKIVLSEYFDGKLATMISLGAQAGMTFDQVETKVMGFDHACVGARLAEDWNLPATLVHAIRYHHAPSEAPEEYRPLCDCIHLADYLTMLCGFGMGGDGMFYEVDDAAFERLGINANDLDHIVDEFVTAYQHQEALFEEISQS